MSRRSALASGRGTLASTDGAKPGRTARAAATHAAIATAEKVLIMTVPCHRALAALVVWSITHTGPVPGVLAKEGQSPENGFAPPPYCFVGWVGTKQSRCA